MDTVGTKVITGYSNCKQNLTVISNHNGVFYRPFPYFRYCGPSLLWPFALAHPRYSEQIRSARTKKVKVAHTRLPSIRFRSWSRFLAVSLQVTWIINPTVGCHYFLPGLQLPPRPLRGYQFCCLVNRGTMGVNSLPNTVTRQRRDCDLNPGPSVPESSTLTTRLPSHPS